MMGSVGRSEATVIRWKGDLATAQIHDRGAEHLLLTAFDWNGWLFNFDRDPEEANSNCVSEPESVRSFARVQIGRHSLRLRYTVRFKLS